MSENAPNFSECSYAGEGQITFPATLPFEYLALEIQNLDSLNLPTLWKSFKLKKWVGGKISSWKEEYTPLI